jgi:hypothetical protein
MNRYKMSLVKCRFPETVFGGDVMVAHSVYTRFMIHFH